jgi:hypothetical protein
MEVAFAWFCESVTMFEVVWGCETVNQEIVLSCTALPVLHGFRRQLNLNVMFEFARSAMAANRTVAQFRDGVHRIQLWICCSALTGIKNVHRTRSQSNFVPPTLPVSPQNSALFD